MLLDPSPSQKGMCPFHSIMLWQIVSLMRCKGLNRYGRPKQTKQTNAQKDPFNVEQKLLTNSLFKLVSPLICSPPIEPLVFESV